MLKRNVASASSAPVSTEPTTLQENLMLALCALPFIKGYLPWCQEKTLSPQDVEYLKEQQKQLDIYKKHFPASQEAHAEALGLDALTDDFTDLRTLMHKTDELLSNAFKKNKISSFDMSWIRNNIFSIVGLLTELSDPYLKSALQQKYTTEKIREKRLDNHSEKQYKLPFVSHAGIFSQKNNTNLIGIVQHFNKEIDFPSGGRKFII